MDNINSKLVVSATVMMNSLAQKKIAEGIKVFNLSAGEPKLRPYPDIVKAVHRALTEDKTFYPPVDEIPELKTLASDWMNTNYHCRYTDENCLPVNGGKLGLYLLLQLLLKNKDEVIIASPYWVSYPGIVKLFGGVPKIIQTTESGHWKLSVKLLKETVTAKTKILILNSAANPTGVVYTQSELEKILKFAYENNILVISDEVYSGLVYDHHQYISSGEFRKYLSHIIIIQSCSKNFSMTGWRLGFVFADKLLINQLTILLGQSTSGVTTISQWAGVEAFKQAKKINHWINAAMQKRRDILLAALRKYFNIIISPPASGLYLFIELKKLGVKSTNSAEFCQHALDKANVVLVPGSAFGQEGFVRFSFGGLEEDLIQGIKALSDVVAVCSQRSLNTQ